MRSGHSPLQRRRHLPALHTLTVTCRRLLTARAALAIFVVLSATAGCQTMSLEEARKITASFGGNVLVPPPRSADDIVALIEASTQLSVEIRRTLRTSDEAPPATLAGRELGRFYLQRGWAARQLGRGRQAVENFTRAVALLPPGVEQYSDLGIMARWRLAEALAAAGDYRAAVRGYEDTIVRASIPSQRGWLFVLYGDLAELYAEVGDLSGAERAMAMLAAVRAEASSWRGQQAEWVADQHVAPSRAWAIVLELRGRFVEAEAGWRAALATYRSVTDAWRVEQRRLLQMRLALCLLRQGRLVEAEVEARAAVLGALRGGGGHSTATVALIVDFARIVGAQRRFADAERLLRIAMGLYERAAASPVSSLAELRPRRELARVLAGQRRWREAEQEYDRLRARLNDDELFERVFRTDLDLPFVLLRVGEFERAQTRLASAVGTLQTRFGARHPVSAEARGLWAMARLRRGDVSGVRELETAAAILGSATLLIEEDSSPDAVRDERVKAVLAAYVESRLGTQSGAAEAFRVADVIRSRSVQRAIDAVAARGLATSRDLATLVRDEQDARKQIIALQGLRAAALGAGTPEAAAEDLRNKIDSLRRARDVLERRIADRFPAYSGLMHSSPATTEQVQEALRSDEALIATLVTEDTTYVWALARGGRLAFAAVRVGEQALQQKVTRLRRALDPRVPTIQEIPTFDIATAHELYRLLLEPVKVGWEGAETLLIVGHGPLGQVPFALLPTGVVALDAAREPRFANYRAVPWLIRRHTVTTLPSVSALVTLRGMPPGPADRWPFAGFGDPYFTAAQALEAAREATTERVASVSADGEAFTRSRRLALRDVLVSPGAEVETSKLAMLPRLPDTAGEILSIAQATGADLARDVFLGLAANEQAVKTMELSRYRIVAFATHGLVPGDLDGLTQPALALTAPEVAKAEGDGLLTMEEILALRLDADWVVLSACNTANGAGTGAEAISGLGRAFFYAGARALLVTHWPVETTSARALTTGLFERQARQPGLSRGKALQATMNTLIDDGGLIDPQTGKMVFSYAHPIFWAPFALVGDGG